MIKGARRAYLEKMTAQLQEWGAKVNVAKAKFSKGSANVCIDFHTQIEKWQKKESVLNQNLKYLYAQGADGFETMKSDVQQVLTETTSFLQSNTKDTK